MISKRGRVGSAAAVFAGLGVSFHIALNDPICSPGLFDSLPTTFSILSKNLSIFLWLVVFISHDFFLTSLNVSPLVTFCHYQSVIVLLFYFLDKYTDFFFVCFGSHLYFSFFFYQLENHLYMWRFCWWWTIWIYARIIHLFDVYIYGRAISQTFLYIFFL